MSDSQADKARWDQVWAGTVPLAPPRCKCCDVPTGSTARAFCNECHREHGAKLAPRDPETFEPACPAWQRWSNAFDARLAALPAPRKVSAEAREEARKWSP